MSSTRAIPKKIAGARTTKKFISVPEHEKVDSVRDFLSKSAKSLEVIDYIYVIDDAGLLTGVVSIKELQISDGSLEVRAIMKKKLVTIDFHADQEKIISIVLKHKLKAIPVVSSPAVPRLEGVIPYDAILSVINHEFHEDILKSGGIHHGIHEIEELTTPASKLVKARIPSLMLGLLGGLAAAVIIGGYESTIESYLILAAFMPVMIYLSDAVGTQSQTLVVRMIALEPSFSVVRYVFREFRIGAAIGAISGAILILAAFLGWSAPAEIGFAIGAAIFASIIFQSFVATYLSIALSKLNIDPATTSGPLTTIISDLSTLVIYFAIASLLLQIF